MPVLAALMSIAPPPRYLSLPSVGVDISDTSLKYIKFAPADRQGNRALALWGDIDIPSNVLNRGHVEDQEQLSAVLAEFKRATGASFVRVSLPEERAYLFETSIKRGVPLQEVRSLLEFRFEENVPIPLREAIFDYEVLPTTDEARELRVSVAAYARETITRYFEACVAAGLTPVTFEVEAQAMGRAVVPDTEAPETVMLIDFGKTRTGVGIVRAGTLMYTSTIDIGGARLSQVLRKALGDLPEAELTKIKNTEGLVRGENNTRSYEALVASISVIKDEIAARMQYWHTRKGNQGEGRISSVILCGGSSNLKGLPEYLSDALGVPTTRANVWRHAFAAEEVVPPIDRRYSYGYATAIGLALGSEA